MFELMQPNNDGNAPAVIKVIGVGGGGGNAVQYMMDRELAGVGLYCANTDLQALNTSPVKNKIQLGKEVTRGLGAGANPEVGHKSAVEDREEIMSMLDGADMLFIAAGMGGGTGTGAAPVIAEIAKQAGILTVAVVTKPFTFEGGKRSRVAAEGINALAQHVDSLITIPNDRLLAVMGKSAPISKAFDTANAVLYGAVQGISDLIVRPGLINVDFADVKTVMSERGIAMMGAGIGKGENRAQEAAEKAISSPLLENIDLSGAKGVLVNITGDMNLTMDEYATIGDTVRGIIDEESTVVIGTTIDNDLEDELRVTIVATGIDDSSNASTSMGQSFGVGNSTSIPVANEINTVAPQAEPKKTNSGLDFDIPAFLRRKAD
ncbi:MAG: cell division protein FtsZ [Gammaproteobacteria bacterium]|nr:cell division protein FtsZ [Gammaproteobacteria bacterium]